MKWTNKGHEYDEMYKNIEKKKRYYFGKSFAGFVKNYGSEWRM